MPAGEFRKAVRAAGVDELDVDDTAARRMFMLIDADNNGHVQLEELLEVLTEDVMRVDDPVTRMMLFHKGKPPASAISNP